MENFQFLGGGGGQGDQASGSHAGGQAQAAGGQGGYAGGAPARGGQTHGGGAAPLAQENYAGPSVPDDDIPF